MASRPDRRRGAHHQPASISYGAASRTPSSQGIMAKHDRHSAHYAAVARRRRRKRKIVTAVVTVFVCLFVGAGVATAAFLDYVTNQLNHGDKSQAELDAITDVLSYHSNLTEPFYMMLLGSDARAGDTSMGARTDTNIVVRVDPVDNKLTMVSIPRDTKIEIEGTTQKFNAAYSYGGAAGSIKAANELLGIRISHYAEVNFESLMSLVDAVGGVDVYVDETIDDNDADLDYRMQHNVIEKGEQHLDGQQALTFARSRAFADGDFTRTSHQRELIIALIDKILAQPITQLPTVIQKASTSVTTDLSIADIIALAEQFKDEGDLVVYNAMVPSYTQDIGGISYVINDAEMTAEMMEVVEAGEDPAEFVSDKVGSYAPAEGSSGSWNGSYTGSYTDTSTGAGTGGYGPTGSTGGSSGGAGSTGGSTGSSGGGTGSTGGSSGGGTGTDPSGGGSSGGGTEGPGGSSGGGASGIDPIAPESAE